MTKPSIVYENIESDQTMQIKTQRENGRKKNKKKKKKTTQKNANPSAVPPPSPGTKNIPSKGVQQPKNSHENEKSPNDTSNHIALSSNKTPLTNNDTPDNTFLEEF